MESKFTVSNVLATSWKALVSQIWVLAGLMIGYYILSLILALVLTPMLPALPGQLLMQLISGVIALIFSLGYLKNLFQTLDGDEPQFSAYGQQARKIGTYFVSTLLVWLAIFVVAALFIFPYFFWLFSQYPSLKELVVAAGSNSPLPEVEGAAAGLAILGSIVLSLPAVYIYIRVMFAPAFIVEEDTGIIESIRKSYEITKGQEWPLFLLGLVSIGLGIAGFFVFFIGIFVAMPLIYLMYCCVFSRLNVLPQTQENLPVSN
jgi:uncharacterized membrane protein